MADTEKITINMSAVDLGRIDLLVEEGFYSNRTDFIRTAIRKELDMHGDVVKSAMTRRALAIGAVIYSRKDLEKYRQRGEMMEIRVVGAVVLADDITPELALATIRQLKVIGVLRASDALKTALAERIS